MVIWSRLFNRDRSRSNRDRSQSNCDYFVSLLLYWVGGGNPWAGVGVGVEQILDFWQNLPEFPFSTRHYQWSFFFEFELGRFDHHIHWFFILANITGSHFNNFLISEIIFIFALCFLPISNPHPMIVHRKVKPCDQKQRVSSRDQEFFWQKFLVFL